MKTIARIWPKVVSGAAILAVAAVAGVISYDHIYGLSIALHQPVMVARLMPFGVDGLITVGSVVLLQGGRLGWLGIGPGVAISLFANIESGIRYGWLAAVWAGIPAVSFALASFIFEHWLKSHAKAPVAAPLDATVTAPAAAPAEAPEPLPADAPESAGNAPVRPIRSAPGRRKPATPESTYAALLAQGQLPSIRAIKRDMHVGDIRARVIYARLEDALKAA